MNLEHKMSQTYQLTAVNQGLKYFRGAKTALHSNLRPLYEIPRSWSKNKVCCTPLKLQLLFKVQLHASTPDYWSTQVKTIS